jgi:AcrR family transcriptional regulator
VDTATRVRRPRSDGQRNRDRVLHAAIAAFAEAGQSGVTLESIARRAGVGIGTLYRHFPSREALVEAVYRDELARLCDNARELLESLPPDVAMRTWMDRFADYVAAKRGIADTLRALVAAGTVTSADTHERLTATIQTLLSAGATSGALRADLDPADVFAALTGIFLATEYISDPSLTGRLLDLLMHGLRTPTQSPLA